MSYDDELVDPAVMRRQQLAAASYDNVDTNTRFHGNNRNLNDDNDDDDDDDDDSSSVHAALKFYEKRAHIAALPYLYAQHGAPYEISTASAPTAAIANTAISSSTTVASASTTHLSSSLSFSAENAFHSLESSLSDSNVFNTVATATTAAAAAPVVVAPPSIAVSGAPSVNWTSDLIAVLDGASIAEALNPEHQQAQLDARSTDRLKALARQCRALASLANNFLAVAVGYAKVIVSEAGLPANNKTIRPVDIGGQAGGEKYLAQGILFKFATDWHQLYGGDEFAMKAASHELRGLLHVHQCQVPELFTPLMALIDYHGHRIIAMSIVPIDDTTIVYGSPDGGLHVHADDARMNGVVRDIAQRLNLAQHWAGYKPSTRKQIYGPTDIEGHLGRDGRFYMIDFARLFPPEPPTATGAGAGGVPRRKGVHLYELLRPELVRSHDTPLSSDAGTFFSRGQPDAEATAAAAVACAERLHDRCIPLLAIWLSADGGATQRAPSCAALVDEAHRRGINCRHLGRVRAWCTTGKGSNGAHARELLLLEMIARVVKNLVRKRTRQLLKELRLGLVESVREELVHMLNALFAPMRAHTPLDWPTCIVVAEGGMPELFGGDSLASLEQWFADNPNLRHDRLFGATSAALATPAPTPRAGLSTVHAIDADGGYAEVRVAEAGEAGGANGDATAAAAGGARAAALEARATALVSGRRTVAEAFWKVYIKALLIDKFGKGALTREERLPSYNFRAAVPLVALLHRLQDLLGMRVATSAVSEIEQMEWREYGNDTMPSFEFVAADIEQVPERTKHMNAVEQSSATELFLQSMLSSGAQAKRLFDLACAKYQLAAKLQPNDRTTQVAWGNALFIRGRKVHRSGAESLATSEALFAEALSKFRAAAAHEMLFSWGNHEHAKALELREQPRLALKFFTHAEQLFQAGIDALSVAFAEDAAASGGVEAPPDIVDARHRGLFSWASASYDRAIVMHQKPTQAGALYRRAIKAAPARYHDDARRAAGVLADEELATLIQLLMQQEQTLTFAAWRDVRLRNPLTALHWARCFGVAPSQIASILECTGHVRALYMNDCKELSDMDACRAIMALSDSLHTLDLSQCVLLSRPTMTHIISLCTALHSIDVSGCILLRQDSVKRLLVRFHKQQATTLGLECASCGANEAHDDPASFAQHVVAAAAVDGAERRLEQLKLHRLALLSRSGVAALLGGVAQRATALRSLHLTWCLALDDALLESLARQFVALEDLAIVQCPRVTERGVCNFVRLCTTLQHVDVSYSCARRAPPLMTHSDASAASLSASSASASLTNSNPQSIVLLQHTGDISVSSSTASMMASTGAAVAAAAAAMANANAAAAAAAAASASIATTSSTGVQDDSLASRIAVAAAGSGREVHVDTAVLNGVRYAKRVAALSDGIRIDSGVLHIASCQLSLAMAYELLDAFNTSTDGKSGAPLVSALRLVDVTYVADEFVTDTPGAMPFALAVLLAAIGSAALPLHSLVLASVTGAAQLATPPPLAPHRSIGDNVCDRIAALIEYDRADIGQIVLQRNAVTASGLSALVRCFNGSLLDLSFNAIDRLDAGAEEALRNFVANNRALRHIDVSDNGAGADLLLAIATGLLAGINADTAAATAAHDDDNDDDADDAILDEEVVRIRVASPPLPATAATGAVPSLVRRRHRLVIRACNSGALGSRASMRLARALQHRAPVYALAIAGCSLDAESMCTLAAALATSTVRKLDVSRNDFGDRGALALADAMATCALVDLDLRQSKLTDSGIAAVCAAMCGAHDVVRLMCERDAASADGTPRKRLAESGGGGGLSDEALLERTRTIRSGSVSSVLRRVRLEDNRCWTLGARWIARVVECVSSDLKLSVTFGIHRGQITSPEIKQALCHLLCASKLSHVTLVAEEIGPGTSLYREAMLGYQDFLERKRVGARTPTRRSTATLTPITPPVLSPRDSAAEIGTGDDAGDNDDNSDGSDDSKPTTPGRTPASPLASRARPPPEPSAVDVWANLMKKKGGSKVGKYLAKQKPVDNK